MKKKTRKHRKGGRLGTMALVLAMCVMIVSYFTVVASAETVYTITDGKSSVDVSSKSTDIDQVLAEAGITLKETDLVTVTGGSSKTHVVIERSQDVSVQYRGEELSASTYGSTVGDLLNELDICLESGDTVTSNGAPVSTAQDTYDGMVLQVSSTTTETRSELVSVPYETVTYMDPELESGTTVLETPGAEGTNQLIYEEIYTDGTLISSTLTGTKVLEEPVTEVILMGCKDMPTEDEEVIEIYVEPEPEPEPDPEPSTTPASSSSSSSSSSSGSGSSSGSSSSSAGSSSSSSVSSETTAQVSTPAASSGNTITTSSGEVLSYSKALSVTATAYTGGGITATGTNARYGAIAVDPSVIPYGTRMYIVSDDGKYIYGYATAEDCGGAIKGNKIDLYFDSYDTCIQFGRRSCTVYILN